MDSDAEAFRMLMARLGQDGDGADQRYESLRRRLIIFFRLYLPIEAETLADRVLDRVARKLMEGTQIEDVSRFTLGVSRMILMESQSRLTREQHALQRAALSIDPPATPPDLGEWEEEETQLALRVQRLRSCLANLGDSATHVILTYYAADGSARIPARQRLAADLGLSLNALRNRAQRLRGMLERCLAGYPLRDEKPIDDTSSMPSDPS
jgi:DNA-directed RNA polymerase specialized sigma24 family protein